MPSPKKIAEAVAEARKILLGGGDSIPNGVLQAPTQLANPAKLAATNPVAAAQAAKAVQSGDAAGLMDAAKSVVGADANNDSGDVPPAEGLSGGVDADTMPTGQDGDGIVYTDNNDPADDRRSRAYRAYMRVAGIVLAAPVFTSGVGCIIDTQNTRSCMLERYAGLSVALPVAVTALVTLLYARNRMERLRTTQQIVAVLAFLIVSLTVGAHTKVKRSIVKDPKHDSAAKVVVGVASGLGAAFSAWNIAPALVALTLATSDN
jgi:hypothetical protein